MNRVGRKSGYIGSEKMATKHKDRYTHRYTSGRRMHSTTMR